MLCMCTYVGGPSGKNPEKRVFLFVMPLMNKGKLMYVHCTHIHIAIVTVFKTCVATYSVYIHS